MSLYLFPDDDCFHLWQCVRLVRVMCPVLRLEANDQLWPAWLPGPGAGDIASTLPTLPPTGATHFAIISH